MLPDNGKPGDSSGELTPQEKEAVNFFIDYQEDVCTTLRNPQVLENEEEWSNFLVFISNLDNALCKSTLGQERLLFRGVRSEYADKLLFLLDNPAGKKDKPEGGFTPHILQDPSYVTFTGKISDALDKQALPGSARILFVYHSQPDDNGLPVGARGDEVLFQRNIRWLTTGFATNGNGITCISLEKF